MAHVKVERRSMSLEQWTKVMFKQIETLIFSQSYPVGQWQKREGSYSPEKYQWLSQWQPVKAGERFGGPDRTTVFQCECMIPDELAGKRLFFQMLTAAEVMVNVNGDWLDGLDPNRQSIKLFDRAPKGEKLQIRMEVYSRSKPDDERNPRSSHLRACVHCFSPPQLVVINETARDLYYDLELLLQTAFCPVIQEEIAAYLQARIRELLKLFPAYGSNQSVLSGCLEAIKDFLDQKIFQADSPFGKEGRLACVAHSHLDIAYFWKVAQSIQKNARTTLIQLRLMERWPEFSYAHTQAWCYETLEQYYPEIFSEMKKRIAEGRWEIVGGFYVEPDCNLISAESMVRQIVYGKLYFLEKFAVEVDNCWLPDVFGNSAIMPQILKSGGIDYFVSNKMSTWNDTNRFPHNNFIWRGIDGSEVKAVVPPVHFITWMDPAQAIENWTAMQDKEVFSESLQMYGYGDGGSGVTDEMLHWFYRQQQLPGIPRQRLTRGKEYLHTIFKDKKELPVWDGDLYLEMHRGTFTSKAVLKNANRRGEFLLAEAEVLCTLAALSKQITYPVNKLRQAWKKLLLNQFHDIIPGSHTEPITEQALKTYQSMQQCLTELKNNCLEVLTTQEQQSITLINHTSWQREEVLLIDNHFTNIDIKESNSLSDAHERVYPLQEQLCPDGSKRLVLQGPALAGYQLLTLKKSGLKQIKCRLQAEKQHLENDYFSLDFSPAGQLLQIRDKIRRHSLAKKGEILNQWQLFEDCPGRYNAWDILDRYQDRPIKIQPGWQKVTVCETGPVSAALRLERNFEKSRAVQIIRIYSKIPRIDFETWVDWQETERLLKVAFPVTVKARYYSTDLSAGVLELPTTRNTSWEQAHFEALCHKWVDLSEGNFGVSLLNNCKYGCDVKDDLLRLTLLRAPIRPDPRSDRGIQQFTYSLFFHAGHWQASDLQNQAFALNDPLKAYAGCKGIGPDLTPPFEISGRNIKIMALKMSEDKQQDLILRLFESSGSHHSCLIKPGIKIKEVYRCDLLERPLDQVEFSHSRQIKLEFRPYEIKTIRMQREE